MAPSYSRCSEPSYSSCTGVDEVEGLGELDVGVLRACSSASAFCTAAPTSTSLAPRLRATSKPTTGLPSSSAAARGSAMVSLMRATWSSRMRRPSDSGDLHVAPSSSAELHGGQRAHRLLAAAQVGAAAGALGLHLAQLARDVGRGGAQRLQLAGSRSTCTSRVTPPTRLTAPTPRIASSFLRDVVVDEPARAPRRPCACEAMVKASTGCAAKSSLVIDRVAHVGRQVGAHALHGRAHVVDRFLHRLLEPELDDQRGRAVLHLGRDVLEALDGGDRVLELARDVGFELRRRGARQRGRHRDGRQVDVGEVLHLHRVEGQQAAEGEQHEQHHRRDRVADGPGGDVHHGAPYFAASTAGCAGGLHHAHQVAVVQEAGALDHDARVGRQLRRDLDAVAHAAAGLDLELRDAVVGLQHAAGG